MRLGTVRGSAVVLGRSEPGSSGEAHLLCEARAGQRKGSELPTVRLVSFPRMWLRLQSDVELADAVVAKGAAMAAPVAKLGSLAGEGSSLDPFELTVSPVEFLLAVGRATAAVGPTSVARFNTVGCWAVRRWSYTLKIAAAGHVELASNSDNIRNHHRTAFSEALGLGASLLIAEYLLAGGTHVVALGATTAGAAPVIVDIDSVLPGNTVRPDLWVLAGPVLSHASPPDSILAEAKGRTPKGALVNELARGTRQVLAITGSARRIVAGVEVPRRTLNAFAVEVFPMGPPLQSSAEALKSGPTSAAEAASMTASSQPAENGDLGSVPPDAIAAADAARLSTFAGLDDVTHVERHRRALAPGVTVDLDGVTFRVSDKEGVAELTVGLLADVAEDVRSRGRDLNRFERSRAMARAVRATLPRRDPSSVEHGAIAEDGCAIAVRRL
jgi:hypothetical protein